MVAIRLPVVIGENRRLVVDLPLDVPVGPAELILWPMQSDEPSLREILQASGVLANYDDLDDDSEYVSDEELETIGQLPPGAPSSETLVDEDRGVR